VAHDRNASVNHCTHRLGNFDTAFHLHTVGPCFEQSASISNGLVAVHLVGEKRHVSDHKSTRCSLSDNLHMVENVLKVNRYGAVMALNYHP